jgi:hypothetical protein
LKETKRKLFPWHFFKKRGESNKKIVTNKEVESFSFLTPSRIIIVFVVAHLPNPTYLMLFAHVVAYKVAAKNVHLNYVELSRVRSRLNFSFFILKREEKFFKLIF